MNGAIAELLAMTRSKPTSAKVITIGANQNFLCSRMKCQSSLTTWIFDITNFSTSSRSVVSYARDKDASMTLSIARGGVTDPSQMPS